MSSDEQKGRRRQRRATGWDQSASAALIVECESERPGARPTRILAARLGGRLVAGSDREMEWNPGAWPLLPSRWPERLSALALVGTEVVAEQAIMPWGSGSEACEPPPIPCPNHSEGHVLDGVRLAVALRDIRPGCKTRRVNIADVEAPHVVS